jgi:hypothetical protein
MNCVVVDTNVVLVANGQHQDVSPGCVAACATRLQTIMRAGKLALDDRYLILLEYHNKTTPKTGNRPGNAFVKWTLQNNANPHRVNQVPIEKDAQRGFVSFPDDPDLEQFDDADRKFVAVAATHPEHPPILQAVDSKWLRWSPSLQRHGIVVEFLCPDDIARFQAAKSRA